MYRWILLSSLLLALCSAKCKKGDIIFTGDGKSFWIAEVGEESVPQLLAPVKKATFLNRNTRILEVIIKPACGEVKLMKISVDTRNIQEIQVLGKKQSLPSRSFEWRKTSITFMEEVVDQIVIKVRTEDYEAAIRSIFVKACLVRGAKTIEEQLYDTLLDVQEAWAEENYERIADEFYPEKSLKVIQSLGVLWGKKEIVSFLEELIPTRKYAEREIIDAGQLSETRAYSIHKSTFYTDETRTEILKPVFHVFVLWIKEGGRWKLDRTVVTTDGSDCHEQ